MKIELGATVMTPITDQNGENTFVYGTLTSINSRWAYVKIDDTQSIRVGKTKIELVSNPRKEVFCPKCNTSIDVLSFDDVIACGTMPIEHWTKEHHCVSCDYSFGKDINANRITRKMSHKLNTANYQTCTAHSGRKSKDNGDKTAELLRGKSLEECYAIASEILEISVEVLVERYSHLNNGQQRMCLGNKMRGVVSRA